MDLLPKQESNCMTTDLNDKQACVEGDIRSLCELISLDEKAVQFLSVWLFSSAQPQNERELFTCC